MTSPESPPSAEASDTSFQERALGGAPNPLEHIDHLFHHTARRIWLGVLGVAILIAAGIVWTAVAKEVTTIQAQGVIEPRLGLFTAQSFAGGQVTAVRVSVNSAVATGEPLATVQPPGSTRTVSVVSPIDGTVLSVDIRAGDVSQPGSPMFLIAPRGSEALAIVLYPAAQISQVQIGQKAQIAIDGVDPQMYGLAMGHVVAISPIPVSDARLVQLTGNSQLLSLVAQLGPLREIDIALDRAHTPSGLAWTEGHGPPNPIPVGVRAAATVTTGEETLIHKAFG